MVGEECIEGVVASAREVIKEVAGEECREEAMASGREATELAVKVEVGEDILTRKEKVIEWLS